MRIYPQSKQPMVEHVIQEGIRERNKHFHDTKSSPQKRGRFNYLWLVRLILLLYHARTSHLPGLRELLLRESRTLIDLPLGGGSRFPYLLHISSCYCFTLRSRIRVILPSSLSATPFKPQTWACTWPARPRMRPSSPPPPPRRGAWDRPPPGPSSAP